MSTALKAFVIGATGQCGKAITKELARASAFTGVTLFTRRQLELPPSDQEYDYGKIDQKIVNFDRLSEDHASDFIGYDVGFGCLGLSVMVASEAEVMKVEHDYTLAAAELAKAGGCKHFAVITGGADKDSCITTFRIKGIIEHDLQQLGFQRLTIVRPGRTRRRRKGWRDNISEDIQADCGSFGSWQIPYLRGSSPRQSFSS